LRDFPHDFLWGASTSAHQVEGGNVLNDWFVWEQQPDTLAVEPAGRAIDHWNRYDEDFALLAELGHQVHRFSIEWSRIEPVEGVIDEDVVAHYGRVLDSLEAHGIAPIVTLYHKTLPQWFAARGGWRAPDAVEVFVRYVTAVSGRLAGRLPWICTINEPQILAVFGHLIASFPPSLRDPAIADEVNRTLMVAHREAVRVIRSVDPTARVGVCLQLVPFTPLRPGDPDDVAASALLNRLMTEDHLSDLRAGGDVGDFLGVQYYTRAQVDSRLPNLIAPARDGVESTQMGWEVQPEGFAEVLRLAAEVGLPLFITENGIATADDSQRLSFLQRHLAALRDVMVEGVPVLGYLHWSAFDNYEWNHGFGPTFGLIGVEPTGDLQRVVRPTARAYAELVRTGRLDALSEFTTGMAS
jgi:beta-glucosidase